MTHVQETRLVNDPIDLWVQHEQEIQNQTSKSHQKISCQISNTQKLVKFKPNKIKSLSQQETSHCPEKEIKCSFCLLKLCRVEICKHLTSFD